MQPLSCATITIRPVPPFRLDFTAWALRRRPHNLIDRFQNSTYSRVLALSGETYEVAVSQPGLSPDSELIVRVRGHRSGSAPSKKGVEAMIGRMLGTHVDLSCFYTGTGGEGRLRSLAGRFKGLKPPRFPTVFEALVNGIACQQLSLDVGILLLNRLCEACGPVIRDENGNLCHAFPGPEDVGHLDLGDLRRMGFSRGKGSYILDLAGAVASGSLQLENLQSLRPETVLTVLRGIRGVGRWTAEYVLLRGLGDLSIFPGDDVGGRNRLQSWLHLKEPLTYQTITEVTAKWKPYQGFIYFHLLLDALWREGYVKSEVPKETAGQ